MFDKGIDEIFLTNDTVYRRSSSSMDAERLIIGGGE